MIELPDPGRTRPSCPKRYFLAPHLGGSHAIRRSRQAPDGDGDRFMGAAAHIQRRAPVPAVRDPRRSPPVLLIVEVAFVDVVRRRVRLGLTPIGPKASGAPRE